MDSQLLVLLQRTVLRNHKGTPRVKNGAKHEECKMPQGGEKYGQEERKYTKSKEGNRSCGLNEEQGSCGKEREWV